MRLLGPWGGQVRVNFEYGGSTKPKKWKLFEVFFPIFFTLGLEPVPLTIVTKMKNGPKYVLTLTGARRIGLYPPDFEIGITKNQ